MFARKKLAAVTTAVIVIVLGLQSPALAAAGYIYYQGNTSSWGYYNYNFNVSGQFDNVRLKTQPGSLGSGKCLTTWFDWYRNGLHFDARASRTCKPSTFRDSGTANESYPVEGMQKLGICFGLNQTVLAGGTCDMTAGIINETTNNGYFPNLCTRTWWLTVDGMAKYDGGGVSTQCNG